MNPELHLVDLGEVSADISGAVSTGKFEILVDAQKESTEPAKEADQAD